VLQQGETLEAIKFRGFRSAVRCARVDSINDAVLNMHSCIFLLNRRLTYDPHLAPPTADYSPQPDRCILALGMSDQHIKLEHLKPGPRHEQLPPSLIARIEALRSTLESVYPLSMAEWLDGFQRDAHPEEEVLWWERLARCYGEYISRNELNAEQRKAAFSLIFKLGMGASARDLAADVAKLPPGALDDILPMMRMATGS
jgi:hypothetical protein